MQVRNRQKLLIVFKDVGILVALALGSILALIHTDKLFSAAGL